MNAILQHWEMVIGRWYGPLSFRLLIQPTISAILAVRAGLADARNGRPAYGWELIKGTENRFELIRDGWRDITKLFCLALVLDAAYQVIVFRWLYSGQCVLVATTLAVPAYAIVRGPTNRIARRFFKSGRVAEGPAK